MENLYATIRLISIVQALFLFMALFVKKGNQSANRFLSLIILVYVIDLLEHHLAASGYYTPFAEYQLAVIPYAYVFGPAFFLYTIFMISRNSPITRRAALFFIPFMIALGLNIFSSIQYTLPARSAGIEVPLAGTVINYIVNGTGIIYETTLYILAFYYLHRYGKKLKEYFSDINRLQMNWLKVTIVFLIVVEIAINSSYILSAGGVHEFRVLDIFGLLSGMVLLFIVAFFAITQPDIFHRIKLMKETLPDKDRADSPRYEKLRLSPSEEERLVQRLRDYMETDKPHLEEDLTLKDLAEGAGVSPHHLSMILNIHIKQSFYTFINSYRVEEVKKELIDPAKTERTILSIAFDCGFNSKSTFNTIFKQLTGETPGAFRSRKTD